MLRQIETTTVNWLHVQSEQLFQTLMGNVRGYTSDALRLLSFVWKQSQARCDFIGEITAARLVTAGNTTPAGTCPVPATGADFMPHVVTRRALVPIGIM